MISLRISEEEYDSLKHFSEQFGARNLSEFARIALHRLIGQIKPNANGGNHPHPANGTTAGNAGGYSSAISGTNGLNSNGHPGYATQAAAAGGGHAQEPTTPSLHGSPHLPNVEYRLHEFDGRLRAMESRIQEITVIKK